MKEQFEIAEIELVSIIAEDIVTTSPSPVEPDPENWDTPEI